MTDTDQRITQFLKIKRFFESVFYLCSLTIAFDLVYFLGFLVYHQSATDLRQFTASLPGTVQFTAILALLFLPITGASLMLWFYAWRRLCYFDRELHFLTEIPPQQQLRRTLLGVGGLVVLLFAVLLFGGASAAGG